MDWFVQNAPIRQKMLIVVWTFVGLIALAAASSRVGGTAGMIMAGGAILAGAAIGLWFRKGICDPYVTTVVRMEALAAGDLESPIQFTDYKDCVGRMTRAMFTFRDTAVEVQTNSANLRDIIQSVNEGAQGIRTGSHEIAQASEDLARRTETNAATLQETSAALSQIDERLRATASAASRTVTRADEAIGSVRSGRSVADDAVQAMGRVSESAKGIDSVIEGLDKIAFQTRVLAMNAAVEAGRAGEAGRGFAVVADLVSALAMRAEEEAQTARDQLTLTQADIGTAVEAVTKVDSALESINEGVGEVHTLLSAMAADNQAQSAAVTQISGAISTMDQATQQNAAMVEETSAAARNLLTEVDALSGNAAKFDMGGGASASRPRAVTPAPVALAKPARKQVYVSPVAALANGNGAANGHAADWSDF